MLVARGSSLVASGSQAGFDINLSKVRERSLGIPIIRRTCAFDSTLLRPAGYEGQAKRDKLL